MSDMKKKHNPQSKKEIELMLRGISGWNLQPIDHYHCYTGAMGDLLIISQKKSEHEHVSMFFLGSPMILPGFFFVYHAGLGAIALWPGTIRVQWREEGKDCGGAGGMAFESTLQFDNIRFLYCVICDIISHHIIFLS